MSKETLFSVIAVSPKHADDICAVSMNICSQPTDGYLSMTALMTIAQARDVSNRLAKAADDAEMKLPK